MNHLTPTCRICGQPIALRQPPAGSRSSASLGQWGHLLTEAGVEADRDHAAVR
jgi:hypothetical protein